MQICRMKVKRMVKLLAAIMIVFMVFIVSKICIKASEHHFFRETMLPNIAVIYNLMRDFMRLPVVPVVVFICSGYILYLILYCAVWVNFMKRKHLGLGYYGTLCLTRVTGLALLLTIACTYVPPDPSIQNMITDYDTNLAANEMAHIIQSLFQCCGDRCYTDWKGNISNNSLEGSVDGSAKYKFPISCLKNIEAEDNHRSMRIRGQLAYGWKEFVLSGDEKKLSEKIYTEGCREKLIQYRDSHVKCILAIGGILWGYQLTYAAVSLVILCKKKPPCADYLKNVEVV